MVNYIKVFLNQVTLNTLFFGDKGGREQVQCTSAIIAKIAKKLHKKLAIFC